MLAVQQRRNHGIQSHRFALTGGAGYEQVWHFGQVGYVDLIVDGRAYSQRQLIFALLIFCRGYYGTHGYGLRILVGYFDAYCAFTRNGRDDAYPEGGKTESYVIAEIANLGYLHSFVRTYLVECDGGAHGSAYVCDAYAEIGKCGANLFLILELLVLVYADACPGFTEQAVTRELIVRQLCRRIKYVRIGIVIYSFAYFVGSHGHGACRCLYFHIPGRRVVFFRVCLVDYLKSRCLSGEIVIFTVKIRLCVMVPIRTVSYIRIVRHSIILTVGS